jgi:hypothetical protein
LQEPIATTPLAKMSQVSMSTLIRKILARIPTTPGNDAVFMVRRDGRSAYRLEITTLPYLKTEVWGNSFNGPLLPVVSADLANRPLSEALQELADRANYNIILDARAAEKGKTAVTARLLNVPLDTAVGMLADQADLKPFLIDNMLYVTTKENANRLEEQEKLRLQQDDGSGRRAGSVVPFVAPVAAPGQA